MGMYNMLFGTNPLSKLLLAALKLSSEDVGRFRDTHIADGKIAIYTRNGGGNREEYAEVFERLRKHPQYLSDQDDKFDSTYATIYFSYPPELADLLKTAEQKEPFDPDARWIAKLGGMGR